MNRRIKKKIIKRHLSSIFSKEEMKFYGKYPRLFPTYTTFKDFTLRDVDRWYKKFSCNKDIFQNIIHTLSMYVNFDKLGLDFENKYSNLEKYTMVQLMDNLEEVWMNEILPKRIEGQLAHYLVDIPKVNTGDALRFILKRIK